MDAYLDIVSVRVVREYADRQIPDESLHRILEAGRATGSSQNRQQWKFYVIRGAAQREALAESVYAPDNIRKSPAVVGITTTGRSAFDIGRCAQNMILAAWADGIGSAPNGVREPEQARSVIGHSDEESISTLLSLGYPLRPHTPKEGDAEGILRRIKRKPLDELVVWVS